MRNYLYYESTVLWLCAAPIATKERLALGTHYQCARRAVQLVGNIEGESSSISTNKQKRSNRYHLGSRYVLYSRNTNILHDVVCPWLDVVWMYSPQRYS